MAVKSKAKRKITAHQFFMNWPGVWFKMIRQNKLGLNHRWMAFKISLICLLLAPFQGLNHLLIQRKRRKINWQEQPPVFIVGHWRSGTTHLHNLMVQDRQFGFLTNFQSFTYTIYWVLGGLLKPLFRRMMPEDRLVDNVKLEIDFPQEEEQSLANISECTGTMSYFFPQNLSYYEKYNLFENITKKEKRTWQQKYRYLLDTICIYNKNKPLLLKNPHNTSRIKELLELYPNAKFVFIHRNPYDVYPSMLRLYDRVIKSQYLQEVGEGYEEKETLKNYQKVMQKYFAERDLIPEGKLVEVSYQQLDQTPIETVAKIYQQLEIGGFEKALPRFNAYLKSLKSYKKNSYDQLDEKAVRRIQENWGFAFEQLNYPLTYPPKTD